jgi:hypothetical protein
VANSSQNFIEEKRVLLGNYGWELHSHLGNGMRPVTCLPGMKASLCLGGLQVFVFWGPGPECYIFTRRKQGI